MLTKEVHACCVTDGCLRNFCCVSCLSLAGSVDDLSEAVTKLQYQCLLNASIVHVRLLTLLHRRHEALAGGIHDFGRDEGTGESVIGEKRDGQLGVLCVRQSGKRETRQLDALLLGKRKRRLT